MIERTGEIAYVYALIGVVTVDIAFVFRFTAPGHSERFVREASALTDNDLSVSLS